MELEVGDIVMCTVERIAGTIVFVNIDGYGQGSIILSEIAPGRIRNLREYVVPKKKIVCKVLRISPNGNIDLSLRRVTPKEKKEITEQIRLEQSYRGILKSVLGDKSEEIINEILKEETLYNFLENAKEDPKDLEKLVGKEASKILEILKTQKQKKVVLKKDIRLTSTKPNGLELIKDLTKNITDAEIKYISAGKYSIKTEAENLKVADNKIKNILENLEKEAKKIGVELN